jgi:hypothetical protein
VRPKLTFKYEEHLYEGKTIGVIAIPKQARPFYLAHAFGKLKSNVVYVRRGSTTDEAEPPEVADMVRADSGRADIKVDLAMLTPDIQPLPDTFELRYVRVDGEVPDYAPQPETGVLGINLRPPYMWHDNEDFYRETADFVRIECALIKVQFALHNRSAVQLSNVKVEVRVDPLDGQAVEMLVGGHLPEEPKSGWSVASYLPKTPRLINIRGEGVEVDDSGPSPVCNVRFDRLLPGEERRASDTLALIAASPGKLRLRCRILAAELPAPLESERTLETTGEVMTLQFEAFWDFAVKQFAKRQPDMLKSSADAEG